MSVLVSRWCLAISVAPLPWSVGFAGRGEKSIFFISLERLKEKTELERNSFSMRAVANRLVPQPALRRCRGEDGSGVCSTFLSATLLTTYLFLVIEL